MFFPENFRIFLRPGITDMRKSINTLAAIVASSMPQDIYSSDLFLFCNRRRDIVKVLYWHETGFALWQKRLEKARFPWPKDSRDSIEVSQEQLKMLLTGINFFNTHEKLIFSA